MKKTTLFLCLFICQYCFAQPKTLKNPLLPSGADPWCIYYHGYYYYIHTTGKDLRIWKTKSLADLSTTTAKTLWTPPESGLYSKEIWAPELHFLKNKWYIYFAADDGSNDHHRLYILENASQ